MQKYDRLTTLIERFKLTVHPAPPDEATLLVLATADGVQPGTLLFDTTGEGFGKGDGIYLISALFSALIDWGGSFNPLMSALPAVVEHDLARDPETTGLVALMRSELVAQRCGNASVVNRLCEVLLVRVLRHLIETGSTSPGLLAGLSDPRLSRAIVAIHDHPGRDWRNEDLAGIAGLSHSRFAELFLHTVGETPAAYLRRWRLTLARQDIVRGDRIDAVSRRYGYRSPAGFARAFRRQFDANPIDLRKAAA